jgi:hypothetical protein
MTITVTLPEAESAFAIFPSEKTKNPTKTKILNMEIFNRFFTIINYTRNDYYIFNYNII